jgi:hypothetical protein
MKTLARAIVAVLTGMLLGACASGDGGLCGGVSFKSDVPFKQASPEPGGASRSY